MHHFIAIFPVRFIGKGDYNCKYNDKNFTVDQPPEYILSF